MQPFKDALLFAYKMTPKPSTPAWGEINPYDMLDEILAETYQAAVMLGQRIVNDKLQEHYYAPMEWRDVPTYNPDPILKALEPFPKSDGRVYFGGVIEPFLKKIRKAYKLRRINENKDIPYTGYPLGHDARGGSLEPVHSFTVGQMKYDKEDQGRDALEVIVGKIFTVVSEQGSRMVRKAVVDVCDALPPQQTEEEMYAEIKKREDAMTDEQKEERRKIMFQVAEDLGMRLKKAEAVEEPEPEPEVATLEEGIKAIMFLQSKAGITETEKQATTGWNSMSRSEKETTMNVYKMMSKKKKVMA
jgi:hypothetical protein